MSRPSVFTVFITVFCAFVVMAAHLGTIDHSMGMTGSDGRQTASAPVGMPGAVVAGDAARPPVSATAMLQSGPMPAHRPSSGAMTIVMVCELMVLVTILGVVLPRLITARRVAAISGMLRRPWQLRPKRGLRPLRPPGLSMLCVVRC